MEVSALGLRIDGISDVDRASKSLDKLAQSAQLVDKSASRLPNSFKGLSGFDAIAARAAKQTEYLLTQMQRLSEYDIRDHEIQEYGRELDRLRAKFNPLFAASKKYEAALDELNHAHRVGAINATEHASALDRLNAEFSQASVAGKQVGTDYARLGNSMSGLAAQFQDIGVTAAMGMNPLIVGLQQGTQIAGQMEFAMSRGATAVGVFSAAFKSLLSPITAASIGLTVLVTGIIQAVDWAKAGKAALGLLADAVRAIGPYAALAAAGLAALYAPSIISGLASLTLSIVSIGRALVTATASFLLANPAIALVAGVSLALAAMYKFRDDVTRILGFDIIDAAKNGANYIINSFRAAYEDIKLVWNNFPNIIGAAAIGAANATIRGINAMLDAATTGINGLIDLINRVPGVSVGKLGGFNLSEFDNPFSSMLGPEVAKRNAKIAQVMGEDSIGAFIDGAQKAANKFGNWLDSITFGKKKKDKERERALRENEDAIASLAQKLGLAAQRGEELAISQARLSLNKYATTEQIEQAEALGRALHQVNLEMERRDKFGKTAKEADEYILGDTDPLRGGLFNNQFQRYAAEEEKEKERYEKQLERLREARELQIETNRSYDELEEQAAQQHADRMAQINQAQTTLILTSTSEAFGGIAEILKKSRGEQSGIYRAMFAASKAFAVASATINAYTAISEAWKSAPFPANLAAVAATAPQVFALVSAISGASLKGMAHDGIDSVPETGTWLLERGERVMTSDTSARLDGVLSRIESGRMGSGSAPKININLIESKDRAGQVETRSADNGDIEADVFVADIMGDGKRSRAIQRAFGLRRVGTR